ncbi:MAG: YajQ family cyclic di-GMP-binding protein [Candidatus Saganbacteria bacterium]|nr:YajQ family cyclic di-GMP-binding protein [Candidatus Saganbacteria bacterium]
MSKDASFDIVSKVNLPELDNALHQVMNEIRQRFDFKGSTSEVTKEGDDLVFASEDEFKLKNVIDIFHTKISKRGISPKFFDFGKVESALGGTVKQPVKIKTGIQQEKSKEIIKMIKDAKIKVQSQIQADQIRVSGKNKDDLQLVIQMLRKANLDIELQFVNYR